MPRYKLDPAVRRALSVAVCVHYTGLAGERCAAGLFLDMQAKDYPTPDGKGSEIRYPCLGYPGNPTTCPKRQMTMEGAHVSDN